MSRARRKTKKSSVNGAKIRKTVGNTFVHVFLAILAFIWVLPIFWVILTSFRAEKGSYVSTFFPKSYTIDNYPNKATFFSGSKRVITITNCE